MLQGWNFLGNPSNELIVNALCVYRIGNTEHIHTAKALRKKKRKTEYSQRE